MAMKHHPSIHDSPRDLGIRRTPARICDYEAYCQKLEESALVVLFVCANSVQVLLEPRRHLNLLFVFIKYSHSAHYVLLCTI